MGTGDKHRDKSQLLGEHPAFWVKRKRQGGGKAHSGLHWPHKQVWPQDNPSPDTEDLCSFVEGTQQLPSKASLRNLQTIQAKGSSCGALAPRPCPFALSSLRGRV